jgi:hypothetical protein
MNARVALQSFPERSPDTQKEQPGATLFDENAKILLVALAK